MSVSHDQGLLIGTGFSKTLVAVQREKSVSSMGFEKGKPLNFRCPCHGHSPAHNRSVLSMLPNAYRHDATSGDARSRNLCSIYGSHHHTPESKVPEIRPTNPLATRWQG